MATVIIGIARNFISRLACTTTNLSNRLTPSPITFAKALNLEFKAASL